MKTIICILTAFIFISCSSSKINKPMYCQPYKGYKARMVGSGYRTSIFQKRTLQEKLKKFE